MLVVFLSALLMIFFLIARLVYLMIFDAAYYQQKAKTLHEREREILARQGERSLTEMAKSLRPIKRCVPYLLSIVR